MLVGVSNAEIQGQRISELVGGVRERRFRIGVYRIVALERREARSGVAQILRRRIDRLLIHIERAHRVLQAIIVEQRPVQAELLAE